MSQSKIIAGLEIGTSKTCMAVGEIKPDATTTILAIGEVPSAGVRKGEIADPSMARQCICDAWQLAQDMADVDILSVVLSVTGDHIKGENNQGSYRLPEDEDIIEEEHTRYALQKARHMEISSDRLVVSCEEGGYSVDGRRATYNPVGLAGRTLDINCHVVHGISTRLQNSLLCVRQVPLEVEDMVFAPIATAQMVFTRRQKDAGALLVDIGAGTTDYVCFKDGEIIASGCVPVGGNAINQDIMQLIGQRVSMKAAEKLKCTEGNAWGDVKDNSMAHYRSENGLHDVSVRRGALNEIIRNRLCEILLLVRESIPRELLRRNGIGVYLCGGTSLMRGLDGLAQYVFGTEVFQPPPLEPGQPHSYQSDPRYCTAIGLIRYAQMFDAEDDYRKSSGFFGRLFNFFGLGR